MRKYSLDYHFIHGNCTRHEVNETDQKQIDETRNKLMTWACELASKFCKFDYEGFINDSPNTTLKFHPLDFFYCEALSVIKLLKTSSDGWKRLASAIKMTIVLVSLENMEHERKKMWLISPTRIYGGWIKIKHPSSIDNFDPSTLYPVIKQYSTDNVKTNWLVDDYDRNQLIRLLDLQFDDPEAELRRRCHF